MAFLGPKDIEAVRSRFESLVNPVKLVNFTQELECRFCSETRALLEEVAGLSDNIELEVYNFQIDKEKVQEFNIDKIPATVVMGEKDVGIRFFGIPSGYEFASLLESVEMVSSAGSKLSQATLEKIKLLSKPAHIQVFVTPT